MAGLDRSICVAFSVCLTFVSALYPTICLSLSFCCLPCPSGPSLFSQHRSLPFCVLLSHLSACRSPCLRLALLGIVVAAVGREKLMTKCVSKRDAPPVRHCFFPLSLLCLSLFSISFSLSTLSVSIFPLSCLPSSLMISFRNSIY